jgi:hypothetical protein
MYLSSAVRKDRSSLPVMRGRRPRLLILFLMLFLMLLCSCGRKGMPTLASYEKLPAPSLLGAYHRDDAVTIFWGFPKDKEDMTEGFIVLRTSDGTFRRHAFAEAGERTYTDTDFREGTHYRYKILARNLRGILSNDSTILDVTPLEPPPPPTDVSFVVKGASVILSWQSQGKDVRYNVYKASAKGKFGPSPLNASPLSENSFRDSLDLNRIVYYVIRGVVQTDIGNEGLPSMEVAVDPFALVPSAPERLRAFAAQDRVILYWDASPDPWVTDFRVYRRIGNGEYVLIGSTQIPTFVDREQPSTQRDYRVTALGPGKEGPGTETKGVIYRLQE